MVSKAVRKCLEIVEHLLGMGYLLEVSHGEVERLIKLHIGADKRTLRKYLKMFTEDLQFLTLNRRNLAGVPIYRLNIEAIEAFLAKHVKEEVKRLRQLTLLKVKRREEEVKTEKA